MLILSPNCHLQATLRLKMGLSAALASSSIGRSIVKAYMDDASRELIKSLIEFAEFTEGSKTSRAFEKGESCTDGPCTAAHSV